MAAIKGKLSTFFVGEWTFYSNSSFPRTYKSIHVCFQNIERFISESPKGVILFTLGSIYRGSSLSAEAVQAFKEAFAEIPLRVLWKFEDHMDNVPNNVLLTQWVPQRDVLGLSSREVP